MARFGDSIRPELGRTDYTPFLQGALTGGQAMGQGIAQLGAGAGDFLKQVGDAKKKVAGFEAFLKSAKKVVEPDSKHFKMIEALEAQVATAPLAQAAGIAAEGQKALQFLGDQMDRDLMKQSIFFDQDAQRKALDLRERAQGFEEFRFDKTFEADQEDARRTYRTRQEQAEWEREMAAEAAKRDERRVADLEKRTELAAVPPLPDYADVDSLRKEVLSHPTVKDYDQVDAAYLKVQAATEEPSAAGDLSLIFNYMKILDPGSTVREGEFANAQNAAGVPQRIANMYNRAINGERLSDGQRKDFAKQAEKAARAQYEKAKPLLENARRIAKERGYPVEDVVPSYYLEFQGKDSKDLSDEDILRQGGVNVDGGAGVLPPKP